MKKNKQNETAEKRVRKIGPNLDFASVEAYNLLRTNVTFSLPDTEGGKILGITSPCPQEGKSTTSINLSYSLAEAGKKVLLIDADMRRPSIGKVLDISTAPGLSNLLAGSEEGALREGVMHENLTVLSSGDVPPNPSELIGSEKMRHLLDKMRENFDYVIIDLPPVNSVSDPLVASKFVDGVIMVIRHCHTRRRDLLEAIRQLKLVNAHVLGFVYNGYSRTKKTHRYYAASEYYSAFSRYENNDEE